MTLSNLVKYLGDCVKQFLDVVKINLVRVREWGGSNLRIREGIPFSNKGRLYNFQCVRDVDANRDITLSIDNRLLILQKSDVLTRVEFFKDHNKIEVWRSY